MWDQQGAYVPEDREWSWVGEDGVKHGLGEDELTFALSSEEIPAYTLVSHKTWAEWLPAMQVAELVWALPSGHADSPRKAELLDARTKKRAPSLKEYPELKARFREIVGRRTGSKGEGQSGPRAALPSTASLNTATANAMQQTPAPAGAGAQGAGSAVPGSQVSGSQVSGSQVSGSRVSGSRGAGSQVSGSPGASPRGRELDLGSVGDSELEAVLDNIDALGGPPSDDDEATQVIDPAEAAKLLARSEVDRPSPRPTAPRGKVPSFVDGPASAPRRELVSSSVVGPPPPPRREFESNSALAPSSVRRPTPERTSDSSHPKTPAPAAATSRPETTDASRPPRPAPASQPTQPSASRPARPQPQVRPAVAASSAPVEPTRTPSPSAPVVAVAPQRSPLPSAPTVGFDEPPRASFPTPSPVPAAPTRSSVAPPPFTAATLSEPTRLPIGSRPSLPQLPVALAPTEDLPKLRSGWGAGKIVGVVVGLGAVAAGVWFAVTSRDTAPPPAVPTQVAEPPPPPPKELVARCAAAHEPTRVFEFAKPDVKPVWSEPLDGGRVALGFAQTSRLALGLTVSAANLAVSVGERQDDPSPMLSVVPRIANGTPEFLVERAASRLQTARAVAASVPFAIGLREKTIAARRGKEDVNLWPSPWENLSVPEVSRLDANSHAVVIRGGGQRGSVLVGKVSETATSIGELTKFEMAAPRVGDPSLFVGATRVWVAIDGGPTNDLGQLFVGSAPKPALPTSAERVTAVAGPGAQPVAIELPSGELFLQWTDGPIGAQRIVGRVFDAKLEPRGDVIVLSQPGLDAHHGVSTLVGDRVLSVYFVRLPNSHELWASVVACGVSER